MTRFALEPDAETDNALSEQPAPASCETCGDDCDGTVHSVGGNVESCSPSCRREWEIEYELASEENR